MLVSNTPDPFAKFKDSELPSWCPKLKLPEQPLPGATSSAVCQVASGVLQAAKKQPPSPTKEFLCFEGVPYSYPSTYPPFRPFFNNPSSEAADMHYSSSDIGSAALREEPHLGMRAETAAAATDSNKKTNDLPAVVAPVLDLNEPGLQLVLAPLFFKVTPSAAVSSANGGGIDVKTENEPSSMTGVINTSLYGYHEYPWMIDQIVSKMPDSKGIIELPRLQTKNLYLSVGENCGLSVDFNANVNTVIIPKVTNGFVFCIFSKKGRANKLYVANVKAGFDNQSGLLNTNFEKIVSKLSQDGHTKLEIYVLGGQSNGCLPCCNFGNYAEEMSFLEKHAKKLKGAKFNMTSAGENQYVSVMVKFKAIYFAIYKS